MAEDTETGVHDAEMTNLDPIVGAAGESPTRRPASAILAPSFALEDQEALTQEPVKTQVIGPPGYASPDPATNKGLLVPVEHHPLAGQLSEDYGRSVANVAAETPTSPLRETTMEAVPEDLDDVTKDELQKMAKARGLSTSGTKEEIADRITDHDANLPDEDEE